MEKQSDEKVLLQIKANFRQSALSTAQYNQPRNYASGDVELIKQIEAKPYNLLNEADKIYEWLIEVLK